MNDFIVLVCGLNIRSQNRLLLDEQLSLLRANPALCTVHHAGDKGSYRVTTPDDRASVVRVVLEQLRKRCPSISGAAISEPASILAALKNLVAVLTERYGSDFSPNDFGCTIENEIWRAGLAFPIYPQSIPPANLPYHKTKSAVILGAASGAALLAKRQAHNIHWGTIVTDPSERIVKRMTGVTLKLTSRSANIIQELLRLPASPSDQCYISELRQ